MNKNLSNIRILIADDHPLFIDGLKSLLKKMKSKGIQYVGCAANGKELIEETDRQRPDIIFTDIQMPEIDGIQATKIIKKNYPETKVIAVSGFNETCLILDMIEAGASGYVLKNTSKEELLQSIHIVQQGKMYYCVEASQKLAQHIKKGKLIEVELSECEKNIVVLICQGLTNKEIAVHVKHSKRTVENYREKILEKLGVSSTMELVMYAVKHGIYNP